ncbi:MAG: hypothetical protein IPK07_12890 [Deltaproteobacteria bacterium]|nr:hypothetical protein [Deltaproteobacteria bacterium]
MMVDLETTPDALVLLGVVALLFVVDLTHSLVARGGFVTRRFFGFALTFFLLKGLVDVPRTVDETPFVMNFGLLAHGRFNLGVHLLLLPLLRCSLAYLGFGAASAFLRWKRRGDVRFFRLNGFSMLAYCSLGVVVEGLNTHFHWWTWKMDVGGQAPGGAAVGWFALWMVWGIGCFPSVLLNFLDVKPRGSRPPRTWRFGLAYLLGYWVLVIGVSAVAPMLRNPVIFLLALFELGSAFVPGGPRVIPLLRQPAEPGLPLHRSDTRRIPGDRR